jgi:hypothetical protein
MYSAPTTIREWAHAYRERGFALARLRPGEKQPTDLAWTRKSCEPSDYSDGCNIGVQSGRLSGDLVCVDIDAHEAVVGADRYLPGTAMVDGREGKPRSHRWYRVADIPTEWTATCAGGIGGPRTVQFSRPGTGAGRMVVEFRGTGTQAVVPPSIWTKEDGSRQERRMWASFGEPPTVAYLELLGATARLAEAFEGQNARWESWKRPRGGRRGPARGSPAAPDSLPIPSDDAARRALAYVAKMAPAVEGEAGDHQTYTVACTLVRDFALTVEQAMPILLKWNRRCVPPWKVEDLLHKLEYAAAEEGRRGSKLRRRSAREVEVRLRPGDHEVLVGVACAGEDRSYIDLAPDLWAGLARYGKTFGLLPDLDAIDWTGRRVTLATPSNVVTNKKVVWDEYRLAHLLRQKGADVWCMRIPSGDGLRKTLPHAAAVDVVRPPLDDREARAAARTASAKARATAPTRRAQPRTKASPALERAVAWLRQRGLERVTNETVRLAKRSRISERTLRRAVAHLEKTRGTGEYSQPLPPSQYV